MLSPFRLSSVCRLSSVTLVRPTQPVKIFGNLSLAPGLEPLRRGREIQQFFTFGMLYLPNGAR